MRFIVDLLEGRTIEKIIIALCERPVSACQMGHTSILVAMSRVRGRDGIRLLGPGLAGLRSFDYITSLRPSPFVDAYVSGYGVTGDSWDPIEVISYVQGHRVLFRR